MLSALLAHTCLCVCCVTVCGLRAPAAAAAEKLAEISS
jgi:hypothetical protein